MWHRDGRHGSSDVFLRKIQLRQALCAEVRETRIHMLSEMMERIRRTAKT